LRYYIQLLNNLKSGKIAPVNLFYGPEGYLREQAIYQYKKVLVAPETAEFNFDLLDGQEASEEDVAAIASSPPMMGERRLVVVRRARFFASSPRGGAKKKGKKQQKNSPLLEYIAAPLSTTCLIFETGDSVDRRKKAFKEISGYGGALEFSKLKTPEIIKWITQLGRRGGKDVSRPAAELLAVRCSDMYDIKNEMEKLISYKGTGESINEDDVSFIVTDRGEENIFAVVDALGTQNYVKALDGIRYLLLRKESPQAILGMLARQVRLVLQAGELSGIGCSFAEISKQMKVPNFVCKNALAQSKNFKTEELVSLLRGMLQVDEHVKTGKQEFYPAIEMLLLDSCIK